jgi:membrane protein implicated in regulation of membrane protease activity
MAVLLIAELASGALVFLFSGLGALAAALMAKFLPDSLAAQLAVFSIATIAGLLLAWRKLKIPKEAPPDGTEADGQQAEAAGEADGQGHLRVRYRGSEWPAQLADVSRKPLPTAGDKLLIVRQEGSLLIVAPVSSIPPVSSPTA